MIQCTQGSETAAAGGEGSGNTTIMSYPYARLAGRIVLRGKDMPLQSDAWDMLGTYTQARVGDERKRGCKRRKGTHYQHQQQQQQCHCGTMVANGISGIMPAPGIVAPFSNKSRTASLCPPAAVLVAVLQGECCCHTWHPSATLSRQLTSADQTSACLLLHLPLCLLLYRMTSVTTCSLLAALWKQLTSAPTCAPSAIQTLTCAATGVSSGRILTRALA